MGVECVRKRRESEFDCRFLVKVMGTMETGRTGWDRFVEG